MYEQIVAMIADQLAKDPASITPETRLIEDLKADSLEVVEMIMELEDKCILSKLNRVIPDEDLEKLQTIQNIVDYIEAHS